MNNFLKIKFKNLLRKIKNNFKKVDRSLFYYKILIKLIDKKKLFKKKKNKKNKRKISLKFKKFILS